jgi:hypothetical protein
MKSIFDWKGKSIIGLPSQDQSSSKKRRVGEGEVVVSRKNNGQRKKGICDFVIKNSL